MSSHAQIRGKQFRRKAKVTAAVIGWGAVLWIGFLAGPYLYAFNDLIQWR